MRITNKIKVIEDKLLVFIKPYYYEVTGFLDSDFNEIFKRPVIVYKKKNNNSYPARINKKDLMLLLDYLKIKVEDER